MKRFIEGEDRRQATLLPDCLDDDVAEDNPVRVVEVFIDELDLAALGFAGMVPEVTGRPSYHPATLLKIYLYGYLNRIQRGYYHGEEVLACEGTGILPCIPKIQTSGNAKRGLFTVADFIYDTEKDRYTCPAGEHLTRGKVRSDRQDTIDHYRNLTACPTCALKSKCTPDKMKRLKRWEHEGVLDRMQARLERW